MTAKLKTYRTVHLKYMTDITTVFREAHGETVTDLARLQAETKLIQERIVVPGWTGENHGMPRTLYGSIMNSFSFIDLLSQYWHGGSGSKGQTVRMIAFMDQYIGHEHLANSVAVQLRRHTLMHTANPRSIKGAETGVRYRWLLHWGSPYLLRDQHMIFQKLRSGDWILNIGLGFLVQDVVTAADTLFSGGEQNAALQENIAKTHMKLAEQAVRGL